MTSVDSRPFWKTVKATHHGIARTDPEGCIPDVTSTCERITGYSVVDAVHSIPEMLRSGEMPEGWFEHAWETIPFGEG